MHEESQEQIDSSRGERKTILIVDDDQAILHMLRKIFVGRGFQISVARDGLEATERLRAEPPALVITDLRMPSLSGADLISLIRQTKNDLPIIVMTAYPSLYPEREGDKGIKAYFRKPFDINEMLSSVERILDNQGSSHGISK